MRTTIALQIAALLSCAVKIAAAQVPVAPTTAVPNTTQIAPLKVGGNVTAPRPIYTPDAEYSEEARKANHKGTCVLTLVVGVDGKPSNITVLHQAGMGLDEKAIEAVHTWIFEPARKEGTPVPVQIRVSMSFNIGNLGLVKIKQASKIRAEFKKRMQAFIYRIPDNEAPKTCPISASDETWQSGSGLTPVPAGSKYRLDRIVFFNNKVIGDQELLRKQFPIKDGGIYDSDLIPRGFSNLHNLYAAGGYIDSAAVPHTTINDSSHTISLDIFLNEGSQFFVSQIDIIGLDERAFQKIKKNMLLEPGTPYNQRLVDFFLEKQSKKLLKNVAIAPSFSLQRNEQKATVAITYDFRRCSLN